jgi:hypothetical protein
MGAVTCPAPSLEGVQGQANQASSPAEKAGAWRVSVCATSKTIACDKHQVYFYLTHLNLLPVYSSRRPFALYKLILRQNRRVRVVQIVIP